MAENKLTADQSEALNAELKAGADDVPALAKKYSLSLPTVYQRRKRLGLPPLVRAETAKNRARAIDMSAVHADIEAGEMSAAEIKRKHGIGRKAIERLKREARSGIAEPTPVDGSDQRMSAATAQRQIAVLARIAAKYPQIFESLEIIPRLAKRYPNQLGECL